MSTGPYLSVQSLCVIGKEATPGTIVTPSIGIPIDPNPSLKPNLTWGKDDGLRGAPVEIYNDVPLTRFDEYTPKGKVFLDTFPNLMMALLGNADSVSGTIAPYLHSMKLKNTANTGSQPPSYSIADYDIIQQGPADNTKLLSASQLDTLTLDFAATGALSWSAKFLANPFVETGKPTVSYSSEVFVPAYNGSLLVDGSRSFLIVSGSVAFKRNTEAIMTIGQQGPYRVWAGPIGVTGKLMVLALKTDQTMTTGLTYYKRRLGFSWTDPVSSHSMAVNMTQVQYQNSVVDRSKTYVMVQCEFTAEANATNAASGYSPIAFLASNGQSTPY